MKNCTDVKQSKKLAEILPIESADLWWAERYEGYITLDGGYVTANKPIFYISFTKPSDNNISEDIIKDIPCWSLAALLDIYPMIVGRDVGMYCCWQNSKHLCSRHYDNPIDACYEMILKLNERKII